MANPVDVLEGVAQAMEDGVPELTTALSREADPTDNTVRWPHGDITIVSNIRADQWNTDFVGYATDGSGNQIGYLYDAKFDTELQLNIWMGVPSDDHDIQSLGSSLERYFRRFDENRHEPDPLPDGSGGTLDDAEKLRIVDGGELPTESDENSPIRGYQITVDIRFTDRIDTSVEYGEMDYVATIEAPSTEELSAGDDVAIEYTVTA